MTSTQKTPTSNYWLNRYMAEEELMVMSEVANTLGVATITIRRLLGNKDLKAPSRVFERGGYKAYLYTREDVLELADHFNKRVRARD